MTRSYGFSPPQLSTLSLSPLPSLVLFQFLKYSEIFPTLRPLNMLLFLPAIVSYSSLGSPLDQIPISVTSFRDALPGSSQKTGLGGPLALWSPQHSTTTLVNHHFMCVVPTRPHASWKEGPSPLHLPPWYNLEHNTIPNTLNSVYWINRYVDEIDVQLWHNVI